MKNLITANLSKGRYKESAVITLINAQIDNSLELGWSPEDIILISNFPHSHSGVTSIVIELNKSCLTGSKLYSVNYALKNNLNNDEVIWAHDLDAWQNTYFETPEFLEVGIACYSNSKYNGGSVFWKRSAIDIVEKIISEIESNGYNKEEPTLNRILKDQQYKDRVTVLNHTFNVGCSGYVKRWERSVKPIHVCHFHPYNKTAWETHALDRNGLGVKGISDRLENLLRMHYHDLATSLSESGKLAQQEKSLVRRALV